VSDSRPLVLLDVDGVLNLAQFLSSRQRGRLRARDGWYSGRAGGDCHDPYASRIVLSRRWGPMLRSLAGQGAELAWATGWQEEANWYIGPLLGLPQLRWAPAVHGRKAETVIPWTRGRPWAWLEDYEEELATASGLSLGTPHLPVLVDRATGLTQEHVRAVSGWLESL
jgi:hypothetical protein